MAAQLTLTEAAIDAAILAASPNAKSMERTARRLGRTPGLNGVRSNCHGNVLSLLCHDAYLTYVDRARAARSGDQVQMFETSALAWRTTRLVFRKRFSPRRTTVGVVYFDSHAIARLIERGPFDPRTVDDKALTAVLGRAHRAICSALSLVDAAIGAGDLDPALATNFPLPCVDTGGLWVVEPSTSGDEGQDATIVTYLGATMLSSEQHSFITGCDDGDLIAALRDYPEALRRTRVGSGASASLARLATA